ncbi:MAG: hypothetical protein LJE67_08710 [Salaquimonas sp.]|jgi:hypothetical protein|nr:hypothetical protein [Salaquimonas sp.]
MLKMIATAAVLGFVSAGSAGAMDMMKCDNDTVMKVAEQVKMAPEANMEKAKMELDMAKEKMAGGMDDDCAMHLEAASKAAMAQ